MGSGASIDGETAKDVDDIDGKDREKLVECTKSMKELLHIVRQRLKRSKKSASGMRKEFARLSRTVGMINAELRVAMLLDLEETKQMSAPEMQELQLLQAAAALKASALHLNDQNAWNSAEKHDEAHRAHEKADTAGSYFEIFRSEIQLKMNQGGEKEAFANILNQLKGSEGAWSELEQIKEFDHRVTHFHHEHSSEVATPKTTSLSFILDKYRDAFHAQQDLHDLAEWIADDLSTDEVKVEVILPALKGFERFFEKGAEKYNFDFGRVSDLSRCTIQIYDNHKAAAVNKMVEVTKRLLEGAKDGDCPYTSQPYKVIKCTNKFFANRDKGGYMDLNINLLFDKFHGCKSTVCEMQLNFKSIIDEKSRAHKNYELARALHVYDDTAKIIATQDWSSASTALKTGRIEHAILEGNNIPPVDFAQLLADACTEQLKKLTLKQMSVDVLCATSDASYCEINTPNTANAYAELTELILIDSPVTSSLTPSNIQSFKNLSKLWVIETSISDASQHLLSSDVVESLEYRGVTIHLKLGPSFEFTCTPRGVSYFEVVALSSIFEHTQGYNWNNKEGWCKKDVPVKDWFGVTLADGGRHVHSLNLAENNLVGKCVPAHVGLQWSLNVVPDQVTFLNFQNLTNSRIWFLLVVANSPVRRACGSTHQPFFFN